MDELGEIIKSILFVAGEPVEIIDIASKLNLSFDEVKNAVEGIKKQKSYENSGIQIMMFNKKLQLCSNPSYAEHVAEVLNPIKEKSLTKAVLETAAIIAYKQPITRLEIEDVRGVNSDYAINSLIENKLIEVVGRKDAVGKPLMFGTTDEFLKRFNMETIHDLPNLEELLERIEVIHNPNKSLFDFSGTEEEDIKTSDVNLTDSAQEKLQEIVEESSNGEELNSVVTDLLSALNEPETEEKQIN